MIDVFTPKRISPDCLFKRNHRQVKISILIPRCAIYLRSMLHADIISAVGCAPQRSSPRYAAHSGDHLCGMLHTAEIISAVCCTLLRSSSQYVAQRRDNFVIEYIKKIETEFKNTSTFACLLGAHMGSNHKKT